jgi:hypothetical protein
VNSKKNFSEVTATSDADLDAVVSQANEGKLEVATVKKAHKKHGLRLPLFKFLIEHRRSSFFPKKLSLILI